MSKFQVGDKVTIKSWASSIGDRKYGVPYNVVEVKDGYYVRVDSPTDTYGSAFGEEELLRYEPDHVVFKPEADALMIEAVRKWRHDWFNEPVEGVRRKAHLKRLDSILDGTPWPD